MVKGWEGNLGKQASLGRLKRDLKMRLALNKVKDRMQTVAKGKDEIQTVAVSGRRCSKREKKSKSLLGPLESNPDFSKFMDWAKKFKRDYKTKEEIIERFKIWSSFKKWVDTQNALEAEPGVTYGMTMFADMTYSDRARFYMAAADFKDTQHVQDSTVYISKHEKKRLAKERAAFEKWVKRHDRDYSCLHMREIGFTMHRLNSRWIKSLIKENPGRYSTLPIALDMMLDQQFTLRQVTDMLNGCPAPQPKNKIC